MKKRIRLLFLLLIIMIGIILFLIFKKSDYEVKYKISSYNIKEKYNKKDNYYYFTVSNKDNTFDFVIKRKYTHKKKIITKLSEKIKDDVLCLNINGDDFKSIYICKNKYTYLDAYQANIIKTKEDTIIDTKNNIDIYKKGNFYIWNGYGLTNIINGKEYNFLKKESYDNPLSYKLNNYLIIANYDEERQFSKFYIFNVEDKKISEFNISEKIDFDSYFIGDDGKYIYLFDKKEKKEYKLNIYKKKIEMISNNEEAHIYNNGWETIGLNKFVYNELKFKNDDIINYEMIDNKLYYHYKMSDINILIANDIKDIISVSNNNVYYLKDTTLYKYNLDTGNIKLLNYFEWNFSYNNKIFIFD